MFLQRYKKSTVYTPSFFANFREFSWTIFFVKISCNFVDLSCFVNLSYFAYFRVFSWTQKNHPEFLSGFAVLTRLELATSCVTGRHSNQTELQHLLFFLFLNPFISLLITGAKIQPFFKSASTFSKKINYFLNYFTSY